MADGRPEESPRIDRCHVARAELPFRDRRSVGEGHLAALAPLRQNRLTESRSNTKVD